MKISKYKFRDIDKKWILIDRPKDIKKIKKKNKIDLSLDPVLGIIYIDHDMGLTIRILGNIYKENSEYLFLDKFINENIINIRIDKKNDFNITILNDKVIEGINNTLAINKQIDVYYSKKAIIESRKMECLDIFRHKYFPDDIELYNKKDDDDEIIWGRIIDCSINDKIVICELLDNSLIDEKYKEHTLVMAKYEETKNDEAIVIKSNVKKVEKTAN